jgi:hypothetical protein
MLLWASFSLFVLQNAHRTTTGRPAVYARFWRRVIRAQVYPYNGLAVPAPGQLRADPLYHFGKPVSILGTLDRSIFSVGKVRQMGRRFSYRQPADQEETQMSKATYQAANLCVTNH